MAESDLELALLRVAWRLDALDKWRADVDGTLGRLNEAIRKLETADSIAAAVAERLGRDHVTSLSRREAFAAVGLVLVTAVVGAADLVSRLLA